MERKEPDVYRRIVEADRASRLSEGGTETPWLRSTTTSSCRWRPTATEKLRSFGVLKIFHAGLDEMPEGMWLAETAADSDTLEF
jgi:hypothetical protein